MDVVYVATPHTSQYAVTKAALEAGKHVLCEKPLSINAREAAELVRLAREKSLFLMEAVWTRFLPSVQRAAEIVASGELGEVRWVQADLGFPAPRIPSSGAQVQAMTSLSAATPQTATVCGTKGMLRCNAPLFNPTELTVTSGYGEQRVEKFTLAGHGYTYQLREVIRCLQQGLLECPTMPLADTVTTMSLLDEARSQVGISYPTD